MRLFLHHASETQNVTWSDVIPSEDLLSDFSDFQRMCETGCLSVIIGIPFFSADKDVVACNQHKCEITVTECAVLVSKSDKAHIGLHFVHTITAIIVLRTGGKMNTVRIFEDSTDLNHCFSIIISVIGRNSVKSGKDSFCKIV